MGQKNNVSYKSASYVPYKSNIIWLNFTPQAGHEQRGKRPTLILSPKMYNEKTSLCLCLPITSKVKGYPFEVTLPAKLKVQGVVLSEQIKNLDFTARDITFVCKAPRSVIDLIQKNILPLVIE